MGGRGDILDHHHPLHSGCFLLLAGGGGVILLQLKYHVPDVLGHKLDDAGGRGARLACLGGEPGTVPLGHAVVELWDRVNHVLGLGDHKDWLDHLVVDALDRRPVGTESLLFLLGDNDAKDSDGLRFGRLLKFVNFSFELEDLSPLGGRLILDNSELSPEQLDLLELGQELHTVVADDLLEARDGGLHQGAQGSDLVSG